MFYVWRRSGMLITYLPLPFVAVLPAMTVVTQSMGRLSIPTTSRRPLGVHLEGRELSLEEEVPCLALALTSGVASVSHQPSVAYVVLSQQQVGSGRHDCGGQIYFPSSYMWHGFFGFRSALWGWSLLFVGKKPVSNIGIIFASRLFMMNHGYLPLLCVCVFIQTLVLSSSGPMARDVDSLALCMKALLCGHMFSLDPTIPPIPFNTQVCVKWTV